MRVLVCGSREWTDVGKLTCRLQKLPLDAVILHGDARGADRLAGAWALATAHGVEVYKADWDKFPRFAGVVRNLQMLDTRPDLVIAFWDGQSRGTGHTVGEAKKRGIPVEVIR